MRHRESSIHARADERVQGDYGERTSPDARPITHPDAMGWVCMRRGARRAAWRRAVMGLSAKLTARRDTIGPARTLNVTNAWLGAATLQLAICCTPVGAVRAQPPAWQLQDGNALLIVEGDRSFALHTAERRRQIQATVRWLTGWPDTYRPPQALLFVLQEDTVRRVFSAEPMPYYSGVGPYTPVGAAVALPSLSLIVAPVGSERAIEYGPLQSLYGDLLIGRSPTLTAWPPCPRVGLAGILIAAMYNDRDHLYFGAKRLAAYEGLNPAEFLDPSAPPAARQVDTDQRGFGCLVLAHWYLTADASQHDAFQQLFAALGSGRPLADAVPEALGGSLAEFTTRYRRYFAQWLFQPRSADLHRVLPDLQGALPEPVPVPAERLDALLQQTCVKLARCRQGGAAH